MNNPNLPDISIKSVENGFKFKIYLDRFDLCELITKHLQKQSKSNIRASFDPIKLISMMTWESDLLPSEDCEIVLNHFKSVENLLQLSKDALEFSLKSLKISERTKSALATFLTSEQDYYID